MQRDYIANVRNVNETFLGFVIYGWFIEDDNPDFVHVNLDEKYAVDGKTVIYNVDYRLHRVGARWLMYDVIGDFVNVTPDSAKTKSSAKPVNSIKDSEPEQYLAESTVNYFDPVSMHTNTTVNVRSGPGASFATVGTSKLPENTFVTVVATASGWSEELERDVSWSLVEYPRSGWIRSDYLTEIYDTGEIYDPYLPYRPREGVGCGEDLYWVSYETLEIQDNVGSWLANVTEIDGMYCVSPYWNGGIYIPPPR